MLLFHYVANSHKLHITTISNVHNGLKRKLLSDMENLFSPCFLFWCFCRNDQWLFRNFSACICFFHLYTNGNIITYNKPKLSQLVHLRGILLFIVCLILDICFSNILKTNQGWTKHFKFRGGRRRSSGTKHIWNYTFCIINEMNCNCFDLKLI